MKTNKKALKLIEMGLSPKTVLNLKESEIDTLFNKFNLSEQATTGILKVPKNSPAEREAQQKKQAYVAYESEMTENMGMDYASGYNPDEYGGNLPLNYNNPEDDANPDAGGSNDGMPTEGEMKESKKKENVNPWAICTAQLGKQFKTRERSEWSAKQKNKYERCVKDVKQSIKEGKDPYIFLIEKEIVSLVERNIEPRMTKGDLIKMLSEQPTTAPTKPDTKPGVKPGTKPRTRPAHPGKNPNPGENPSPKAVDKEKAKDDVIQVIMKLLKDGK